MARPAIVCHMITSIDGRLLPQRWPTGQTDLMALYEDTADRLDAGGWIVGRRTMEEYLKAHAPAATGAPRHRDDRIADRGTGSLAICIDRHGRFRPETGRIGDDHLVLVLPERVADDHVDMLGHRGVSVLFAGPDGDQLSAVLDRLGAAFHIERLLLEGGGTINGAFIDADLVDETSTLIFPVLDGGKGVPSIYTGRDGGVHGLRLISAETLDGGTVWLRHAVTRR